MDFFALHKLIHIKKNIYEKKAGSTILLLSFSLYFWILYIPMTLLLHEDSGACFFVRKLGYFALQNFILNYINSLHTHYFSVLNKCVCFFVTDQVYLNTFMRIANRIACSKQMLCPLSKNSKNQAIYIESHSDFFLLRSIE